ncbi:polymer-forming cytoskeletal family protein [Stutzerimonas nosocomialis]|uniref:Polymer-forming cytoskeletal family protein n=1 Tax=Stutzerimonas nosocomialis TaxID=1056496 RepID=A0A5R9QEF6_9GAMM|nr:polymer-forming cytoskeletal protein [Stutzerimonas nosocomialis]TLX52791.1 polymer-forming cytoskeletal family protein [Stutzerimonas nosocomialis]TLX57822.1 polymer-forming cytoskeletal family protein [Stutzerimonas nosocomialis]TLX63065.1 polymer-forming cytoskeletal family protein [Stutzerimonas nosocomialis]
MFNKAKPKPDLQRFSGKTSVIAADAEVTGDLRFQGAVQIDGRLCGNLITTGGLVRVSHGGQVEGEIRAQHVVVDGQVTGDVHAAEHLELGSQARVRGNLFYGLMEMAMGAEVEGKLCHLREEARPLELPASVESVE